MTASGPVLSAVLAVLISVVIGVLPGTVVFRLPILRRETRAALPAEERWFWQFVLSAIWSVGVTVALGSLSSYSLPRLLGVNLGLSALLLILWRSHLLWRGAARRPGASLLLPLLLLGFGLWRFLPASEYIIGGKDPGVYLNEGVSLHRTGTIFRRDAVVAEVPVETRDLFFHDYPSTDYYGSRFMGVFLNDPDTGEVISQFPHFLPASIALGYGAAGLRGATTTVTVWALCGLLAVYFFGVRLVGRAPAFFACLLIGLNVIEVWCARYPNAEVVMQSLVFAGLLAFSYALRDGERFFGWTAGALAASLIFLRFDGYLAISAFAAAASLVWIVERRSAGWGAGLLVAAASVVGWVYYSGPMKAYFFQYRANLPAPGTGLAAVGIAIAATVVLGTMRRAIGPWLKSVVPIAVAALLTGLAVYGLFIRRPGGRLAAWDAFALRTFRDAYVFWPALAAGIAGFSMLAWKRFWREPAFFLLFTAFCTFFFYRLRVVPEHFWTARRFVPVILPGLLLLASAAALGVTDADQRRKTWRALAGAAFLAFIGWQYGVAAAPVAAHIEYRGAIHEVERLASRMTDRDLVIVESRGASDMHVFAPPLAYAFGHDVLLLESELPDRRKFEEFLRFAATRYSRVLFVASGGTDLLSQKITATPVISIPVKLPEYATSAWNEYPSGPRQKDLGYSIYQLTLGQVERTAFVLDVGNLDELHVLRFHGRETTEGRTFRWTSEESYIAVTGLTGNEHELTLVMHDGGRPATAPPATVELFLNDTALGTIPVGSGFKEYRVALPPELVRAAALGADPAHLKLRSSTWRPSEYLGGTDDRVLGVMIDRVEIH